MRFLLLYFLSLCMFFPPFASAQEASPEAITAEAIMSNPLAMTITEILVQPTKDKSKRSQVSVLPERKNVFLMEKEANLRFTYQLQADKMAPLVFIIPGTGGTHTSAAALFMAERLYAKGYHTVTIDNGFSWTFTVAGSRSGLPGYTPRDAQDMYVGMQTIASKLANENKIRPSSYSMSAFSLGGLEALFIHRLDDSKKVFNFNHVLIVDPPVDVMNAVKSLDRLYAAGDQISEKRKLYLFNRVIEVGRKYLDQHADLTDPALMVKAFTELNFNDTDMAYLIGGSFRDGLRDVIFASQQVDDKKILKIPATRTRRSARYDEAHKYSFQDYMKLFLYPEIQKSKPAGYDFEDMNQETSLYQFGDYVQSHPGIYIAHTADDFILKDTDVRWIQSKFGSRAIIFPHGGHCGAMNFPQFKELLNKIF